MGGGVNSSSPVSESILDLPQDTDMKKITLSELFERHFPYYLSIGMSYDDYWNNGDPNLCRYYRKAEEYRRRRQDEEQWWMGRYIYEAIGALSPILKTNLSGKEVRAEKYVEMPFLMKIEEEKKAESKRLEEQAKNKMTMQMAFLQDFASKWNKKRKKELVGAEVKQ